LCLNGDRFEVRTNWRTPGGSTGEGQGIELTHDTGYFWFFNPNNVETVIKVLDACSQPSPSFWVFAAGLTNIEVMVTVTDSATGEVRSYDNPIQTPFEPIQDTDAFATCP
jgi:hypothetical protein